MSNFYNEKHYVTIDPLYTNSYSISISCDPLFNEIICTSKNHSGDHADLSNSRYFYNYIDQWKHLPVTQITDKNSLPVINLSIQTRASLDTSILIEEANKSLDSNLFSDTYPIATRYIDSQGTYYIERPPFQANIDYKMGGAQSRTKKKLTDTMVWVPWTLFVLNPKTQKSAMYFSHKSLTNMDDIYFATYLPNTYQDGSICYSSSIYNMPEYSTFSSLSVSQLYSFYINEYFAGAWNADLSNPWSSLFYRIHTIIHSFFPEDEHLYPMMFKLFNPSDDELKKVFGSKISYINYMISARQTITQRTASEKIANYSLLQNCDNAQSHHYILTMLSTFSLQEILDLLEEYACIRNLIMQNPDHPYCSKVNRYYFSNSDSFQYYGTFSQIVAASNSSNPHSSSTESIADLPEVIKKVASKRGISSPYNYIDARVMIINNVSDTSSWAFSSRAIADISHPFYYVAQNFTDLEYKKLLDKIISDYSIDPHTCSNSLYCYDFLTKEIYVIPYSVETYVNLLEMSIKDKLDIVGYSNAEI